MKKDADKSSSMEFDEVRARAEKWMLGDISPEGTEKEDASVEAFSHEEQSQQQLVHALLLQKYETEDVYNAYVDRGMETLNHIEDNASQKRKITPLKYTYTLWGGVGMAASFLICLLVFFVVYPSNSAMAAMDRVISQLEYMGDRVYSLRVEKIKQGKKAKKSHNNISNTYTPRFDKAELYLRGNNQFVLIEQKDNGRGFIKGSNGEQSWKIHGSGNDITIGEPGSTKLPLSSKTRTLVFLDLAASLNNLKEGYDISMQENQALPGVNGSFTKIVAEKIDRKTKGVKRVELYFDPDNYYIQRLVFDRVHLPGDRERVKITLDLQSTEPLAENFFEASTHAPKGVEE